MSGIEVPGKWDHEADVIIVGGGTAGLPAAITVAEAGLKATVLEWKPACGGSFNMVAGAFGIAGSDEQKELGIEDGPDLLYADLVNVSWKNSRTRCPPVRPGSGQAPCRPDGSG